MLQETDDQIYAETNEPPPPVINFRPTGNFSSPPAAGGDGGLVGWLRRTAPTVAVLAALAAVGYWGHKSGWKLPKFSELNGSATATLDDWCAAHDVPESICVECRPELFPPPADHGFCKKHGVHNCSLCNPDVAQLASPPAVSEAEIAKTEKALALLERAENNPRCLLYKRRIQFASVEAMQKAGVDVELVGRRPMTEFIAASGELEYDPTRVARLTSPISGKAWRIEKSVGDRVEAGEVLFLVASAEVGRVKVEFLQALAQVEQTRKLLDHVEGLIRDGVYVAGSRQEVEAAAALRAAELRLLAAEQSLLNLGLTVDAKELKYLTSQEIGDRIRFLGLPAEIAARIGKTTKTANLLPITAPHAGVVTARDVATDEVVGDSKTLFVVADTSHIWLTLHVLLEDVKHLRRGQEVRFSTDERGTQAVGEISWISSASEHQTRTVPVRVALANADGKLRPGSFGHGRIVLRSEKDALVVPNEAVHWDGSCHVVFVRDKTFFQPEAPKVFHTRTVRTAAKDDRYTEILAGVLPGEVVASTGSGILRSGLLKNNLGAG